MTVRDIAHHLESTLGTELSHETISKITDDVLEEMLEWQKRPLEPLYPILYLDATIIKVRDGHQVQNRAAHLAVGVDMEGLKHVLVIVGYSFSDAHVNEAVLRWLRLNPDARLVVLAGQTLPEEPAGLFSHMRQELEKRIAYVHGSAEQTISRVLGP
jgi:hypothetical protein